MAQRQMSIGMNILGHGGHASAWRVGEAPPTAASGEMSGPGPPLPGMYSMPSGASASAMRFAAACACAGALVLKP